jgi:hypothetical protein
MKKIKKPTAEEKKRIPTDDSLKIRIINAKALLPKSGITSLLIFQFPELDTVKKRSLMSNVLQLRATDKDITEKLEALVKTLSTKKLTN